MVTLKDITKGFIDSLLFKPYPRQSKVDKIMYALCAWAFVAHFIMVLVALFFAP